jgi:hypothetical protein
MKTLREMMDLIESAQPVDLRARAAELAIQILKNADMDDDSEQGYIRVDPNALFQFHVLMNTAKKQGVAEQTTAGESQEYTVRVVDEEGSSYTVKVTAPTEQGALHKAIVKVRNSGARPEHARIVR